MSRQSVAPTQRNFTLTEELEKLEQSITLTLQEIDHNFSRAHRIVTTSILPVVEKYAQHSSAVWEGSKFWKQFFEASANVSLSSYEEPPEGEEEPTATSPGASPSQEPSTQLTPSSSSYASPSQAEDQTLTPEPRSHRPSHEEEEQEEESTFATPRPTPRSRPPPQPSFSSPYESLKRTVNPTHDDSTLPSTPRTQQASPTPDSSPIPPRPPPSTARTPANDILLHRVLDKNWRLQATPHAQPKLPARGSARKAGGGAPTETPRPGGGEEDELESSPFVPAPELHAEIFESPLRRTRVPGVSLLTPAKGKGGAREKVGGKQTEKGVWDSDSDDEGGLEEGLSPPKTMQFHIPKERLLRTPAREASKRIVEDLLLSAGGNVTDDLDEDSPSVVRRTQAMDDDTF
ncbi:MAG: hypothetical protein Q9195_003609 [Heterodermia aff. obscurata]